ncbi:MAG: serine--tRNA ligase [Candidatus Promineofilum sp.]|nr:serine--tRNA ligase [Promineifilum sp.]MCW5865272.1 serine--tRNA ligase [Anaerolineae bacterium]
MIDINLIREKPEWVKAQIARLNDSAPIDEILAADARRREIIAEVEELRRQRNDSSKQIGLWMGSLKKLEADRARAEGAAAAGLTTQLNSLQFNVDTAKEETRQLGERISTLEEELRVVEATLEERMLWVPNLPHASVPNGPDDSHNIAYPPQGALPEFDFEPKAHWDLGPALGIIDFDRGTRLSGSRFYVLRGQGARLQRAVIQFMLDYHVNNHGYEEIYPPFMVRSAMFVGAGQLPKFADNIYRDAEEDFMWLGTAEIALTNLHRDEILEEADLPRNYVAYTPCFRREKMSAGRDVRGIKRGHQFDKVEMYKFTTPETSYEHLDQLVRHATDIAAALGLPYRIIEMVTGDLGFAAAKKFDVEIWAAGCQEWLEVSSASNCEAFQARRANVRYRPADGGRPRFVHTLNASGLALPRIMIGLIENNQLPDGRIAVPQALQPYMGGATIIG